jgi:hypothetical protein
VPARCSVKCTSMRGAAKEKRAGSRLARAALSLAVLAVALLGSPASASLPRPPAVGGITGDPLAAAPAPAWPPLYTEPAEPSPAPSTPHLRLFGPGSDGFCLFGRQRPGYDAGFLLETRLWAFELESGPPIGLGRLQVLESVGDLRLFATDRRRGPRNRYYDPEIGRFITADPMGYTDGPSMYQFAGYSPANFGDPMGLCLGFNHEPCYVTANRWAAKLQRGKQVLEVDGTGWGSIALNTLSGTAIDAVELLMVDPLRAGASTGEAVGSGEGALGVAFATLEDAGRVAAIAGAAGATLKAAGRGARALRRTVSLSEEIGEAMSVGLREGAAEGVTELTGRTTAKTTAAIRETSAVTVEEGVVNILGRKIKVPYTSRRLPVGEWGTTDKFGNITLKRGLPGRFLEETLRHEAVHRFFAPRSGPFLEARANFGQRAFSSSHLVRYLEESIAESFATRSLARGLRFPFEMDTPVSGLRVAVEGLGYFGGTAVVTHNANAVSRKGGKR